MTDVRVDDVWASADLVLLAVLVALAVLNYVRGSYGAVVVTSIGATLLASFVLLTSD